jgi:hypothetical protein
MASIWSTGPAASTSSTGNLRWNLAGRELGPHPGPRYGWDLSLRAATVSTDGHILVSPSFGPFQT